MSRRTIRVAFAAGLIGLGWAAGRAQTSQPDFELVVNAPVGATTVECRRGCDLAFVERGLNPNQKPMPTLLVDENRRLDQAAVDVRRCHSIRVRRYRHFASRDRTWQFC